MIIYVPTKGEYSSYRILALCSTKEGAKEVMRLYNSGGEIEEWELDKVPDHPPECCMFEIAMDRNGNTEDWSNEQIDPHKEGYMPYDKGRVNFRVWATNLDHAIKIANEKRIQLIVNGEWGISREDWINRYGKEALEEWYS